MERRVLGRTTVKTSVLGLGGTRLLASANRLAEAQRLVSIALDLGVTYFDTARLYPESEVYLGGSLSSRRKAVFLATKTHARDGRAATAHLEESLQRLKTDYIDLWQLHDLRTERDLDEVFGPHGAIVALDAARLEGKARFLGVTVHSDPQIVRECFARFDFDTVMIPVNAAEAHYRSFIDSVLPLAREKNVGVVSMYPFCGGRLAKLPGFRTVEPFLRFVLSQDISVALVGCDSVAQLEENVRYALRFRPMPVAQQVRLSESLKADALELMYYKAKL